MIEVILASMGSKLALAFIAIALMLLTLRVFDYYAGIKFRKGFDLIEQSPMALALYFGMRLIALSLILCGALL
jgi:hypothetical protein